MAVQTPYLPDDGDLNKAARKRAGQSALVSSLPPLTGNPQRAAAMQAQFDQPVTGPRGVIQPAKQTSFDATNTPVKALGGIAAGLANAGSGIVNTAAGAAESLLAAPLDAARNTAARAFGGDPSTLSGGPSAFRDTAFSRLDKGLGQLSTTGSQIAGAGRDALGVAPAKPSMPSIGSQSLIPSAAASERVREPDGNATAAPGAQATAAPDLNAWTDTGNGIAARLGAGGVPEFSNAPGAVTGAQAMPANGLGGAPLRTPGVSNLADDVPLAQRGSINNIGNGIGGGLSVGEDGDAQMSIGRFERANQIRAEMNANRPRELGDAGGRVTVVRDSSRAPTIAERLSDRRERADASAGLDQRRVANDERRTDVDIARNEQQTANDQLSQLKIGQEIEAGQLSLDTAKRMETLRQQLADPNLDPAQRAQLESAYYAMDTSAKDRYMAVTGGTNEAGGKDASRVFDRRTGQYIDVQGDQKSLDSDQDALAIKNNASLNREQKVAALKKLGYN